MANYSSLKIGALPKDLRQPIPWAGSVRPGGGSAPDLVSGYAIYLRPHGPI